MITLHVKITIPEERYRAIGQYIDIASGGNSTAANHIEYHLRHQLQKMTEGEGTLSLVPPSCDPIIFQHIERHIRDHITDINFNQANDLVNGLTWLAQCVRDQSIEDLED